MWGCRLPGPPVSPLSKGCFCEPLGSQTVDTRLQEARGGLQSSSLLPLGWRPGGRVTAACPAESGPSFWKTRFGLIWVCDCLKAPVWVPGEEPLPHCILSQLLVETWQTSGHSDVPVQKLAGGRLSRTPNVLCLSAFHGYCVCSLA